ncbi:MAG: hypothetical protein KatS3mg009_0751 [Acidimicrobiia bacterium]|nr:MAG: hypothetical protein KatS3mg009_0751 [Acidimicrobiia bacterium]
MPRPLVIVESPAKARTIAGYLGDGYTVKASIGHVRDLPGSREEVPEDKRETHGRLAGINPDDHFDVVYVVRGKRAREVVAELRRALRDADELILATDEDREGEAIGWHVSEVLQPKVPVKRMVFHEITPHAIREALEHPRDLDMKLVEAQEARRILDRLVGWETSPVLWRVFGRGQAASAGRVQSVAVRLVVERERARMRFRAGRWHDLEGTFVASAQPFRAALVELGGRRLAQGRDFDPATGQLAPADPPPRLLAPDEAERLAGELRPAAFTVRGVESEPFTERPRAPFTTSTLQQEAARKLRFAASRTMAVAQRLYERGYITYMRTDATFLSEQAVAAARAAIREQYGDEYLPAQPRTYRGRVKNAQEAHEAIRPAGDRIRTPDEVRAELDADEQRLYELIWIRTVACQMVDARGRRMTIRLSAPSSEGEAVFRASGKAYDFLGFRRAYVEDVDDDSETEGEARLPAVAEGETVECTELAAVGPRDEAAGALHRREPGEGARGARHRPALHLRGGHRDDPGAWLRVAQGQRPRARVDRVRGDQPARAPLRAPRRLQLHRHHGGGARRHRARRGRAREVARHLLQRQRAAGAAGAGVGRAPREDRPAGGEHDPDRDRRHRARGRRARRPVRPVRAARGGRDRVAAARHRARRAHGRSARWS